MIKTEIIKDLGFWLILDEHTVTRIHLIEAQRYYCCESFLYYN